ncbi:hypothetical protein B296_00019456 [Ensete ventricosum]|uniref:Uncharacterized protein n=1 Tax=Ensete ventricosum TaxID=4639 RepID=A0A426YJT3_ENSVE|nr:hypothetical protein B296_00019456 [Ensete ventricosum]
MSTLPCHQPPATKGTVGWSARRVGSAILLAACCQGRCRLVDPSRRIRVDGRDSNGKQSDDCESGGRGGPIPAASGSEAGRRRGRFYEETKASSAVDEGEGVVGVLLQAPDLAIYVGYDAAAARPGCVLDVVGARFLVRHCGVHPRQGVGDTPLRLRPLQRLEALQLLYGPAHRFGRVAQQLRAVKQRPRYEPGGAAEGGDVGMEGAEADESDDGGDAGELDGGGVAGERREAEVGVAGSGASIGPPVHVTKGRRKTKKKDMKKTAFGSTF